MFPVAAGAKGQPPMPPRLASSACAPASWAAKALAKPVLRVLWKCPRSLAAGAIRRAASKAALIWGGTATPMVSASAISSGGVSPSARRSTIDATRSSPTSPSKGQPKAAAIVTEVRRPAAFATAATRNHLSKVSATPAP